MNLENEQSSNPVSPSKDIESLRSDKIADFASRREVHLGLVHWPIRDKAGDIICTNVTNFDVHDIARACRTYGIHKYHIINRIPEQQMFVSRLKEHWMLGTGAKYNPMRRTALGIVTPQTDMKSTLGSFDQAPLVLATSAQERSDVPTLSFSEIRQCISGAPLELRKGALSEGLTAKLESRVPILLIFGTGFGLADEVYDHCDAVLPPIRGASEDDYRHLSVRSAVSICLDRLLGE